MSLPPPISIDDHIADRRRQDALLRIARRGARGEDSLDATMRLITESAAEALGVERTSIWFFSADRTTLRCVDLFRRSDDEHAPGTELSATAYPRYFQALDSHRAIDAGDACTDPRTSEFCEIYLRPLGITSMIDATIRRDGIPVGVLCCEHVGPNRKWSSEEQSFAASAADLAAMALESIDRRGAEDALRRSEERYRGFINLSAEGIWRVEIDPPMPLSLPPEEQVEYVAHRGVFAECNKAYARMHGFEAVDQIAGRSIADVVPRERYHGIIEETLRSGFSATDVVLQRPDHLGRTRWFSLNVSGTISEGRLVRFWGVQREVTERVEHIAELQFQATHDQLTGLPNRNWLTNRMEESLRRPSRGSVALLLLDIDGFREVNDAISHEAGDLLLSSIATRLAKVAVERHASLARLGGDEFALLTEAIHRPTDLISLAEAILAAVRNPFEVEGVRLEVGASVGIALSPQHAGDAPTLLRRAEIAMYVAKGEIRRYAVYDPARDPHSTRRLSVISEIGTAIRRRELVLHFQPKVSLQEEHVAGFEGLVRWQHPLHGLIGPNEFIPWVEKSDLIRNLTMSVIESGLEQLRQWQREGSGLTLAINLSARNLLDDEAPAQIETLLGRYGVESSRLLFEITESSMMSETDRDLETIRRIGALGIRFAIDDFGTGYSSLRALRRLPIHELKIDLSFVTHMLRSGEDRAIVLSTIALGHSLGMTVTAEGVEDGATLNALREMGCDYAQGFHIAAPMPASVASLWMRNSQWRNGAALGTASAG